MIALVQRVKNGSVRTEEKLFSEIQRGYVILLGVFESDTKEDVIKIINKLVNLRIMSDENDKMNLSIKDSQGEVLLVSQFTLCADLTYGRRPSFIKAKKPEEAEMLYKFFKKQLEENDIPVKTGKFGYYMDVSIINDGPVTIIMDSKNL